MAQKRKQSSQLLLDLALNRLIGNSDIFDDSEDDHDQVQFAKKSKYILPSLPPDPLQEMSQSELEKLSHEDLVAYVISLQDVVQKTIAALGTEQEKSKTLLNDASKRSALANSTNNVAAAQTLSPFQVAERADKLASMCARGIKKQMKWQPSCKNGTTRWSFSGVSPSTEVFFKMLRLPSGGKPWKMKKISREDFESAVGDINASVRCATLRITSAQINVKWTPETNEFSLSGTYGLGI
ncbi:hypothetical protein MMC22_004498 [Lobaria immixta]|nr:hypothetical protein [Lobaria immixta]